MVKSAKVKKSEKERGVDEICYVKRGRERLRK